MRTKLFQLSERLGIPLLHCDMFPHKGPNVTDLGLCESNAVNVASGMSLFSPVFLYGVAGFILHRFEQLKLSAKSAGQILIFNAGGSNFPCYKDFGLGHTCYEDIELARILKIPVFNVNYNDFDEQICSILLNAKGLSLIQLGQDSIQK